MKTLVINGSPKGESSNTMKLAHAFLEGSGCADYEVINLSCSKVTPCRGCFSCWNKTPGKCVMHDEMDTILQKLILADTIIWAFPLYYYSTPGALKNVIDRQLPLNLPFMAQGNDGGGHPSRFDLSNQRHVVISTCGFWTAHGNYDSVTAMFDHYYGADNYTKIFCGQGELFRVPELKARTDEYLETVKCAGKEFSKGGISIHTQQELQTPLYPRDVFETMSDASWGIDEADGTAFNESLSFTKQMAALYRPDGAERVLEFYYTDIHKTYQVLMDAQGSKVISANFRDYTTRIETPISVWKAIARGEISGQEALFQRQYIVQGDFEIMLHWDELFGSSMPSGTKTKERKRKTSMTVLLLPWIVIWITFAISPTIGGAAGVAAASFIPLLWLAFEPVIFEQVSIFIVAVLSLITLLGADVRIVIPLSYAVFGVMWIIGTVTKIPLTAYYSANNYGGQTAFDNPLFMRTNRILTAAWGALYLVTPIWTYAIMGTGMSAYIGLINSICPIFMGIFTAWFQKWYPPHWAGGKNSA